MLEKFRAHKDFIIGHMVSLPFGISILLGLLIEIVFMILSHQMTSVAAFLLWGIFLIYPITLTLLNLFFLAVPLNNEKLIRKGRHNEYLTLVVGSIFTSILGAFSSVSGMTNKDWTETLYNSEKHTPVWSGAVPTLCVLAIAGLTGYIFLSAVHIQKVPPLAAVCAIAALYPAMAVCLLWIIQVFSPDLFTFYLCVLPFNCIVIGAKTIRYKIIQWKSDQPQERKVYRSKILNWINGKLWRSQYWPLAAFIVMWPLLGIMVSILILFGQEPDSVIKAWTETSDWRLSQQIAPPNVYRDEHYLCTVAAGGHRKLVKPLRMGERHGHRVVVNRQLCIANAFEQVLEERLPRFHRHVRSFYDRYGFPVARLIHSPYAADVVYIIMKPLEWLFLIVLYFCDTHPENRIAVQYFPKQRQDVSSAARR